MVHPVDGRIDLGLKAHSTGNILWIGFRVSSMKCLRLLSICTISGSGDGTPAKPEVHEAAYGLFILQGGVKGP